MARRDTRCGRSSTAAQARCTGGRSTKSRRLASERFNELQEHADAAGVKIDFLPIHCEARAVGTMKMRIDQRMREINEHPQKDETIFVTTHHP